MIKLFARQQRTLLLSVVISTLLLLIGAYLNNLLDMTRWPQGEDELYYWGTIRQMIEFGQWPISLKELVFEPQFKLLLPFLLSLGWLPFQGVVSFLVYWNIIHLVVYTFGFLSFQRLAKLGADHFGSRLVLGLWFILLISSAFWLGPQYFVPSFWLFLAVPNLIVALKQGSWWEGSFWIVGTYFLYSYGLPLMLGVALVTILLTQFKSTQNHLRIFGGLFLLFLLVGLPVIGHLLQEIDYHAYIREDLPILWNLGLGFVILTLLWFWQARQQTGHVRHWQTISLAVFLVGVFYTTILQFPTDTASYRTIILLFVGFGLLIASFDIEDLTKQLPKTLSLWVLGSFLLVGMGALGVILIERTTQRDGRALLPHEVTAFTQLATECQRTNCTIVTDRSTSQLASYFIPQMPAQDAYDGSLLAQFLTTNNSTALPEGTSYLIVSPRTIQLFDQSIRDTDLPFSRTYPEPTTDPRLAYPQLEAYAANLYLSIPDQGFFVYQFQNKTESGR